MLRRWLETTLVSHWYRPQRSILVWLLMPLSLLVAGYLRWRPAVERTRLRVPVVVVGNLTVGGTGKTPLTRALVEFFRTHGWSPGVISRGYGGCSKDPRPVAMGDDPRMVGDEPLLLVQDGVPVWVGRERVLVGQSLLTAHPSVDLLICDDGLQHRALLPTVSLAVIDGRRGWGNGALLPAGPLRESLNRLKTLDAVVINRGFADEPYQIPVRVLNPFLMTLEACEWVNLEDGTRVGLEYFSGRSCVALAGIGHPERFFNQLPRWGIVAETHTFSDHHAYRREDLPDLQGRPLLMTEKDAIKWSRLGLVEAWYLRIQAHLDLALMEHLLSQLVLKDSHG